MKSLKSFARAISPFTSKRKNQKDDEASEGTNEDDESSSYHWDLTDINVFDALKRFYKAYNPDKVHTIDEILGQYRGEEELLLQTLCERYKITEGEMQYFLDKASLKQRHKKDSNSMLDENNEEGIATKTKTSKRATDDLAHYSWNTSGVDLGKAMTQLYKEHNPSKTPNVALLNQKSAEEVTHLLQQLCKRHKLSQSEMQRYLDRHRRDKSTGGKQSATAMLFNNEEVPVRANDTQQQQRARAESVNSRASTPNNHSSNSIQSPPPPPPPPPVASRRSDAESPAPPPPKDRSASISRPPLATPKPTDSGDSPSGHGRGSLAPNNVAASRVPFQTQLSSGSADHDDNASGGGSSVGSNRTHLSMDLRPLLPNGKRFTMGPVLREIQAKTGQEGGLSTSSSNNSAQLPPPNDTPMVRQGTFVEAPRTPSQASLQPVAEAEAAALRQVQEELEAARREMAEVTRDSQEMLRAIQQSAAAMNDSNTMAANTAAALAKAQQQIQQQQALLARKEEEVAATRRASQLQKQQMQTTNPKDEEFTRLKAQVAESEARIRQLEENETQLSDQCLTLQRQLENSQAALEVAHQDCSDACADRSDLLQLLEVMNSSPVAVKNILESFLNKLGQSTGSLSVQLGIGKDGSEMTVSQRIAAALEIKRKQGRELSSILSPAKRKADYSVDSVGSGETKFDADAADQSHQQDLQHSVQVSEDERRMFRQLSRNMGSSGGEFSRSKTTGANRDASPSLKMLQRSAGNNAAMRGSPSPAAGKTQQQLDLGATNQQQQLMADQYDLAKQYYQNQQAQSRISQRLASSNLALQELGTTSVVAKTVDAHKKVQALSETRVADDWIECHDPRTKRQYFYSASLKKSTWTRPASNASLVAEAVDTSTYLTKSSGSSSSRPGSRHASRQSSPAVTAKVKPQQQQQQQQFKSQRPYSSQYLSDSDVGDGDVSAYGDDDLSDALNHIVSDSTFERVQRERQLEAHEQAMQQQFEQYSRSQPMTTDDLRSTGRSAASNSGFSQSLHQHHQQQLRGSESPFSVRSDSGSLGTRQNSSELQQRPQSVSRIPSSRSSSPQVPPLRASREQDEYDQLQAVRQAWVMAVDPKSQRKYWYNRETKVSTWRKPVDLL